MIRIVIEISESLATTEHRAKDLIIQALQAADLAPKNAAETYWTSRVKSLRAYLQGKKLTPQGDKLYKIIQAANQILNLADSILPDSSQGPSE